MARLFISYAREDKRLAKVLSARLAEVGHAPFVDTAIPGGMQWESEISRALSESDWVLVLLSARSVASDFVREEVRRARDMGKLLIPIRVSFEKELPLALGAWLNPLQHLEWSSHEDDDELIRQILGRLQTAPKESAPVAENAPPSGVSSSPAVLREDRLERAIGLLDPTLQGMPTRHLERERQELVSMPPFRAMESTLNSTQATSRLSLPYLEADT